jgi:hypothetical protein
VVRGDLGRGDLRAAAGAVVSVTFALGIPHTPWKPDRVESLERLRVSLDWSGLGPWDSGVRSVWTRFFEDREPNYAWSAKLWTWSVETEASHLLQLQDDAIVAPDFWRRLRTMVEAVPDAVIGLEAAHPKGPEVEGCWYTTADMLIGVGYVVPTAMLREFLAWRARLRKGAIESVNEDTLLGVWCLATEQRIWHPVPTIIDHDTTVASTYGNDTHEHRRPSVTWRERKVPETWHHGAAPYLGRFYESTPRLARRWIAGATEEDYQRWLAT